MNPLLAPDPATTSIVDYAAVGAAGAVAVAPSEGLTYWFDALDGYLVRTAIGTGASSSAVSYLRLACGGAAADLAGTAGTHELPPTALPDRTAPMRAALARLAILQDVDRSFRVPEDAARWWKIEAVSVARSTGSVALVGDALPVAIDVVLDHHTELVRPIDLVHSSDGVDLVRDVARAAGDIGLNVPGLIGAVTLVVDRLEAQDRVAPVRELVVVRKRVGTGLAGPHGTISEVSLHPGAVDPLVVDVARPMAVQWTIAGTVVIPVFESEHFKLGDHLLVGPDGWETALAGGVVEVLRGDDGDLVVVSVNGLQKIAPALRHELRLVSRDRRDLLIAEDELQQWHLRRMAHLDRSKGLATGPVGAFFAESLLTVDEGG